MKGNTVASTAEKEDPPRYGPGLGSGHCLSSLYNSEDRPPQSDDSMHFRADRRKGLSNDRHFVSASADGGIRGFGL